MRIDIHASVGHWPFRQLRGNDCAGLLAELDRRGIDQALVANLHGVFYMNAQAAKLTADIGALNDEKARLSKEVADLTAANQTQIAMLNSVHYLVGARKALEKEGIIVVPVFSKDRAGSNWKDQAFTQSADLRTQDSITLTAAEAGLDKIRKVEVVPGSLVKDQQYSLDINPDQTAATVHILNKDRFRNEKVVFALAD